MKKLIVLFLLSPFILAACLFSGEVAFGMRAHHWRPVSAPAIQTPQPAPQGLQIGFFQPPAGVQSQWTQKYTDGAFPSGSGNLEIYMEPPMNDAAILSGKFDATLKSFAQSAAQHSGSVIVAFGEEVNCSTDFWGGTQNSVQQSKDAFNHEQAVVKSIDPAILVAFAPNNDSCYGLPSASTYYPGNPDVILISGFNFGGQTWDQVFDHAILPLQVFGKPIWAGSEGSVDNQAKFVADSLAGAAKYNLAGIIYYNGDAFIAPASTLKFL